MTSTTRFRVPAGSVATAPPEHRGVDRDGVRLLEARPGHIDHHLFRDLPALLRPGDLVVINTSATLAAAIDGHHADGRPAPAHVSTFLDDGTWIVEVRRADGTGPDLDVTRGSTLLLPGGYRLHLDDSYPRAGLERSRVWRASSLHPSSGLAYLASYGRPIEYGYLRARYPLVDHQTVYAREPGSAEMVSAGRPFTAVVLGELVARGIGVATLVLHAGVSSPEVHEPPLPERYEVPAVTAGLVNSTRRAGGRVVAVGTTVVRALESAARDDRSVQPRRGWTELVLGPDHPARVVGGLVTGLHEPEASHVLLLEAVAGPALVAAAYDAAVRERYLWHEFGDSMLLLP